MAHPRLRGDANRTAHMLLGDALVYRSSQPLAARLGRHRHRALPARVERLRNLRRQHIRTHAGYAELNIVSSQVSRQLRHLRVVAHRRAHQAHLFRARRALLNIGDYALQLARARLAEAIARHAKAAVPPAAAGYLDDVHILKLRPARHNCRGMRIAINLAHPLALNRRGSGAALPHC